MSVIALGILLLLGWTVWQNVRAFARINATTKTTVMLEGVYSLDIGEWKPIDNEKPIQEHFHKAVFKGKIIEGLDENRIMNILGKNVWFAIKNDKGEIIDGMQPKTPRGDTPSYRATTPGYYAISSFLDYRDEYWDGSEITLEVEYPYGLMTESFSDFFSVILSYSEGVYLRFFFEVLPALIMFLLVCFFGVFFFPIASGLLGRIDYRYIAFGALCFFAGAYMVINKSSCYMNLWVIDPAVCMMTDKIAGCFFVIAVLIYLRSLLRHKATRMIATVLISVYLAPTIVCFILHVSKTADMMVTAGIRYISLILCAVIMAALMIAQFLRHATFSRNLVNVKTTSAISANVNKMKKIMPIINLPFGVVMGIV